MPLLTAPVLIAHCDEPVAPAATAPTFGITVDDADMVMPPLSEITSTTAAGTITITAGENFKRCFTWKAATGCVVLDEHGKARYNGFPGAFTGGWPPQWHEHEGVTRVVASEAQLRFPTVDAFLTWVKRYQLCCHAVYRDDGLVVDWQESSTRSQLSVDVWQAYVGAHAPTAPRSSPSPSDEWPVYIGGEKPTKLPGSQNDKISAGWVSELPRDTLSKRWFLF